MHKAIYNVALSCCLLVGIACTRQANEGVLTRQEMADVLYDYHLAQALTGHNIGSDTLNMASYADIVLAKHGISQAEFDSSLLWYSRNSEEFYEVYKTINERLDKEMGIIAQPTEQEKQFATSGDTANIWLNKTSYLLMPTAYANTMHFTQPTDTTIQAKDKIEWRFKNQFTYTNGNTSAVALLAIRYDNDSIGVAVTRVYGNTPQMLTLIANRPTKEVYGHIYLDEPLDNSNKLYLLSQMMLVRYKNKEATTDTVSTLTPVLNDSIRRDSNQRLPVDTNSPNAAVSEIPY